MAIDRLLPLWICISFVVGFVFGGAMMVKAASDMCVPKEALIKSKRCTYSVDPITNKVLLIWTDTGEPVVKP